MYSKLKIFATSLTVLLFLLSSLVQAGTASASAPLQASNLTDLELTIQAELAKKSDSITITYTSKDTEDSKIYMQGIKNTIDHAQRNLDEELYWNMKDLSMSMKGSIGNITINLKPQYLTSVEQDQYVNNEVDRILNEILTPNMNNLEKETAIHDYVVSNTSYENLDDIGHTAYSALYNKKAVCQGYAILTNKLLNKAGITSRLVVGYINDDPAQSHMWNAVNLDNNWYMLDTVFDDPTPDHPGVQSTKYFNVTNEALLKMGHNWVESDYPIAK